MSRALLVRVQKTLNALHANLVIFYNPRQRSAYQPARPSTFTRTLLYMLVKVIHNFIYFCL